MKKNNFHIVFLITSFFIIVFISLASSSISKLVFLNRAANNQLTIQIKLQGEYDKITGAAFKTKVDLYSQSSLVKEYLNQNLIKDHQNIFKLTIDTTGLNLNQMYAIFIKPDKYLGKLFCSPTSFSANCKIPQIVIPSGTGDIDLTQDMLFSGDISPQDGKIAADDLSKIINQIGQVSTSYLAADINSDGMVQTVDYSLALYSLSKNYVDDPIPSAWSSVISTLNINGLTPTPTITPGGPSLTPTPTTKPTPTVTGGPTTTPTPITNPTPTTIPASPTSIPSPTPTTISGGTCNATINGKIYGNYLVINFCSPLINSPASMCVTSASDCTAANCIDKVIKAAKDGISSCTSGGGTINEAQSRSTLSCQVQFTPGPCIPTPTPTISCSQSGPSC